MNLHCLIFVHTRYFIPRPLQYSMAVERDLFSEDNKDFLEKLMLLSFPPNCAAQSCLNGID